MFWMSLIPAFHALAAVLWVGGIFLVFMVLRPSAAATLEPAHRITLLREVFSRFFRWVWLFIAVILVTGYSEIWMLGSMAKAPPYIHLMQAVGLFMILAFAWLYFMPYKLLCKAADAGNTELAARIINNNMKPVIATNLVLGICEVIIGVAGRYWSLV
ncbi:MAG: hypothetical protein CMI02_18000 [Oceanospirillaceae bacterium]|nr:hypothetical protein [Oceanospirillaceae bacterium]MBT13919.1 hypothetical protein [Oceanospirillaceae bacterium]